MDSRKKLVQLAVFLVFSIDKFLLSRLFSENLENFISKMCHQKFESDENLKFFIGGIISSKII